ncbi:MAG: hypothetical protein US96_C0005G0024 [Candidatus Woesebacteria bacterium GW2011_GWB1_38_5b]|uniref:DUF5672 domain-containing protein n=1 Tax=Candidatus Woesebacteria bacterium GW2011_GWB1_38_5b TaxID=1618569 RepID=A0A0G0NF81_9BACT|nr:MAG: hypothetical protein US96_C0005G0024 [Candidatus Woesebacteria bacterium GW2011_GWB1_38_5b]
MQKISNKDVAIVVPAYKKHLSSDELISLNLLFKYLGKYDIFFLTPSSFKETDFKYKGINLTKFSTRYFVTPQTYNKLLLNKKFYLKYKKYKYILIYQFDALVFSDRLIKWCKKGYDYIAAPWFESKIARLTYMGSSPISGGNGGFCLRNVQSCLRVLDTVNAQAKRKTSSLIVQKLWFFLAVILGKSHKIWLNSPADNYPFNEDGFWSLEAPKYLSTYKVAPFNEAVKFAFEKFPRKCYRLNKNKLPFGCHAWAKYDKEFWLPHLET